MALLVVFAAATARAQRAMSCADDPACWKELNRGSKLAESGDYAAALALQDRLYPLHAALFTDSSPGPTKYALARLGRMTADVRLPITEPSEASRRAVDAN